MRNPINRLPFYCDCVNWDRADVYEAGGLNDMIGGALEITRATLLKHVDPADMAELERGLGYERAGLTMARDWHVSYYRSKLHGQTVYFFKHSAIEHVFCRAEAPRATPTPHLVRRASPAWRAAA